MSGQYVINEAKVVSQTLEGETIIINLERGSYYSLNTTGSEIWDFVIVGHSLEHIVQYLCDRYGITREDAATEVHDFVSALLREDLLVLSKSPLLLPALVAMKAEGPYVRPSFERYDDMQEMLLADPIHDVGEAGWPVLKKEEAV